MRRICVSVPALVLSTLLLAAIPSFAVARLAYVTGLTPEEIVISGLSTPEPGGYAVPVDLATEEVGAEISFGGRSAPAAVAIAPDGTRAYVTDSSHNRVVPIDIATNEAEAPIKVGSFPYAIAITPDGTRAYVANAGADTVTSIDLATGTATRTIPVGVEPKGIAITPDGTRAYVTNFKSDTITPIDLGDDTAGPAIPVGDGPIGIAITPDGTRAYVADFFSNNVVRVDLPGGTAGIAIPVVEHPEVIAIAPDGAHAYVLASERPVTPIDLGADKAEMGIPVGGMLFGMAILPDGSRAYITNNTAGSLDSILPPATLSPVWTAVGEEPEAIAIVPNQPPHAAFSASPSSVLPQQEVSFDAGASADPDGSIARYDWNFGDGTQAQNAGAATHHSYSAPGTYQVSVTTTDNEGCSDRIVFTGQTAYCNGSSVATATHTVKVVSTPGVSTPGHCHTLLGIGTGFTPKLRPGRIVPGVRVRLAANRPLRIKVEATLLWSHKGHRHKTNLGRRAAKINHWRRVRFPLPAKLWPAFPYGRPAKVRLRLEARPRARHSSCPRKITRKTLHAHIVRVLPHAIQRG